jgi:hypothetical protein
MRSTRPTPFAVIATQIAQPDSNIDAGRAARGRRNSCSIFGAVLAVVDTVGSGLPRRTPTHAGIHFRSACQDGIKLGKHIGRRAFVQYVQVYRD